MNLSEASKERIREGSRKSLLIQKQKWDAFRKAWEMNPKKCLRCNNTLLYEHRRSNFCSQSCATSINNLGVDRHKKNRPNCIYCGLEIRRRNKLFCSRQCDVSYKIDKVNKKIESGEYVYSRTIRSYLLRTRSNKCQICHNETWMDKPIPVIMDHIDGNSDNNSLDNLRLVCPNCDAQLPTYKSKNKGNGRAYRRRRYAEGKSY